MPSIYRTVQDYAEAVCPDKIALITEEDGTRTYSELRENAGKLGWSLHNKLVS